MDLKDTLFSQDCSLVASNGYISKENGIRPIISKMNEQIDYFKDLEVADRVIGKASAMLLVLSGVAKVYGHIMSKAGKKILEDYGIGYEYGELVEYIVNRKGDGMCPMEMTVKDIDDLKEAFKALNDKIRTM